MVTHNAEFFFGGGVFHLRQLNNPFTGDFDSSQDWPSRRVIGHGYFNFRRSGYLFSFDQWVRLRGVRRRRSKSKLTIWRYFFERILTAAHPTVSNRYTCAVLPVYSRLIIPKSSRRIWLIVSVSHLQYSPLANERLKQSIFPRKWRVRAPKA